MYISRINLKKFGNPASVVSISLLFAAGAILVSRVVFSAPGSEVRNLISGVAILNLSASDKVHANQPVNWSATESASHSLGTAAQRENQSGAEVTVVTHHYSRILSSFEAEDFTQGSNTGGELRLAPLAPTNSAETAPRAVVPQPAFNKKTYIHKLRSQDSQARDIELTTTTPMFAFDGVGFPHIEQSRRRNNQRYKPYTPLIKVTTQADGSVIGLPNVACHGYSQERTARRAARYEADIDILAQRYAVDAHLIKAVIAQESCFRQNAVSPAGAVGLMQLMPATAKWLGVKDKKNPVQNLRAGIQYLSKLKQQFDSDELVLAAYNAGPGNVRRYDGIPPFKETRKYVKRVMQNYHSYRAATRYNAELL